MSRFKYSLVLLSLCFYSTYGNLNVYAQIYTSQPETAVTNLEQNAASGVSLRRANILNVDTTSGGVVITESTSSNADMNIAIDLRSPYIAVMFLVIVLAIGIGCIFCCMQSGGGNYTDTVANTGPVIPSKIVHPSVPKPSAPEYYGQYNYATETVSNPNYRQYKYTAGDEEEGSIEVEPFYYTDRKRVASHKHKYHELSRY